MGRLMAKRLDLERVRSALKKAAKNATSGSTDVRSGRFLQRDATTGQFAEKSRAFRQSSDSKAGVVRSDSLESTKKR